MEIKNYKKKIYNWSDIYYLLPNRKRSFHYNGSKEQTLRPLPLLLPMFFHIIRKQLRKNILFFENNYYYLLNINIIKAPRGNHFENSTEKNLCLNSCLRHSNNVGNAIAKYAESVSMYVYIQVPGTRYSYNNSKKRSITIFDRAWGKNIINYTFFYNTRVDFLWYLGYYRRSV